jgi:hypothetical protein
MQSLDALHSYWQTGNFPVNDAYAYRTPIFIDKYNNFCAVGYLIMASGNEHISRMIAARTNLAYVREMNYPELTAWTTDYGFTVDELAWIQPGYPPVANCAPIGGGVNGSVNELYTDNVNGRLYVGGEFSQVDGSIAAANIAYVTNASGIYTWHTMGTGVNGPVHAIAVHEGKVFVAGAFSMAGGVAADNFAYWDGTSWHNAGCVYGTVYDFAVLEGSLYAAGEFSTCGFSPGSSFLKWEAGYWQAVEGITGRINTIEPIGSSMVLGGAFTCQSTPGNVIKWNASTSFQHYTNELNNEVKDFEVYGDTLYAVCKRTHATDTTSLIMKVRENTWHSAFPGESTIAGFQPYEGEVLSFNTLCAESGALNIGGRFKVVPFVGTYGYNCYRIDDYGGWTVVDSTVNKMTLFGGELIMAGAFKTGGVGIPATLNGIARRVAPNSVPDVKQNSITLIHPNPASSASEISFESGFNATGYSLRDITGRMLASGTLSTQQLTLPQLPAGMYLVTLKNDSGAQSVAKLIVN